MYRLNAVKNRKGGADMERLTNLIKALERFGDLETVIEELKVYDDDREITVDAISEYLEDEADYANE